MKSEINQLHGLLDKSGTSQASRWSQLLRRMIKTENALAHLHIIKRITEMCAPSSGDAAFISEVCKMARGCYTGITIIFTLSKPAWFQVKKQAEWKENRRMKTCWGPPFCHDRGVTCWFIQPDNVEHEQMRAQWHWVHANKCFHFS